MKRTAFFDIRLQPGEDTSGPSSSLSEVSCFLVSGRAGGIEVQQLLGHKSSTMTQRCARHQPEGARKGAWILERHHPPSLAHNYHG